MTTCTVEPERPSLSCMDCNYEEVVVPTSRPASDETELGLAPSYDPSRWAVADACKNGLRSVRTELPYYDGKVKVDVYDGRSDLARFVLGVCGFQLYQCPTSIDLKSFYDARHVVLHYYPEVAEVVRRTLGATLVLPYHHSVRHDGKLSAELHLPRKERTSSLAGPAWFVHNDHSSQSGYDLLEIKLSELEGRDAVAVAAGGRFIVINAWRALEPIQRDPLALADWRSLSPGDGYGPEGELYSPWHRWYYFSDIVPDELLLFKQFDTQNDEARCTLHTTFADPGTCEDAPPRESIDVRCIAFFGHLPPGFGDAFTASLRDATGHG